MVLRMVGALVFLWMLSSCEGAIMDHDENNRRNGGSGVAQTPGGDGTAFDPAINKDVIEITFHTGGGMMGGYSQNDGVLSPNSYDIKKTNVTNGAIFEKSYEYKTDNWDTLMASFDYSQVKAGKFHNDGCSDGGNLNLSIKTKNDKKDLDVYCLVVPSIKNLMDLVYKIDEELSGGDLKQLSQ